MTRCPECGTVLSKDNWPILLNDCCVSYMAQSGDEAPAYEELDFNDPGFYDAERYDNDFSEEWDYDE
jgi:hypothetical protein